MESYLLFVKFPLPFHILCILCLNALSLNAQEINNLSRVKSYLSEVGLSFQERNLFANQGGFGTSIHIDLPATTSDSSSRASLVIACPFQDRDVQENLSFSVRSALAPALQASKGPRPVDLRIALLADEKSELPESLRTTTLRGSRDLADLFEDTDKVLIVYLNKETDKSNFSLVHGSRENVLPLRYLKLLLSSFSEKGLSLSPELPFNELYRLGLIRDRMNYASLMIVVFHRS
ncbi:hypothetical protein MASR2M78_32690 [Treponema sp.]